MIAIRCFNIYATILPVIVLSMIHNCHAVGGVSFMKRIHSNIADTLAMDCLHFTCRSPLHQASLCAQDPACLASWGPSGGGENCMKCRCPAKLPSSPMITGAVTEFYITEYDEIIPDPDVVFPMDELVGSTLYGHVPGSTTGGPDLRPGKLGKALYLNGAAQYVDLGVHAEQCFHNPTVCTNGVTVSTWVMALQPHHSVKTIVFDCGGMLLASVGFDFRRSLSNAFEVLIMDLNGFYKVSTPAGSWAQDRWFHVTFSWYPGKPVRLYINGCDVDEDGSKGYTYQSGRLQPFGGYVPFFFGKYNGGSYYAHVKIDQLQFWYKMLTPAAALRLYILGGRTAVAPAAAGNG